MAARTQIKRNEHDVWVKFLRGVCQTETCSRVDPPRIFWREGLLGNVPGRGTSGFSGGLGDDAQAEESWRAGCCPVLICVLAILGLTPWTNEDPGFEHAVQEPNLFGAHIKTYSHGQLTITFQLTLNLRGSLMHALAGDLLLSLRPIECRHLALTWWQHRGQNVLDDIISLNYHVFVSRTFFFLKLQSTTLNTCSTMWFKASWTWRMCVLVFVILSLGGPGL